MEIKTPELKVKKRSGKTVPFEKNLIEKAIEGAFKAELEIPDKNNLEESLSQEIEKMTDQVSEETFNQAQENGGVHVETIQDKVELQLMRKGYYSVARRYIVYREERSRARKFRSREKQTEQDTILPNLKVKISENKFEPFNTSKIRRKLIKACAGFEENCSYLDLEEEVLKSLFDGITPSEINGALILAARSKIEKDPDFSKVATRLLLDNIYKEALGFIPSNKELETQHSLKFKEHLERGVINKRISPELLGFNIEPISKALKPERDSLFNYIGLQTIYDRYLLHINQTRIETPQFFWMRVAMGLALGETKDREKWAVKFYNTLSTFRFISATPTLFNSGTNHPQLSSCFLSTVEDNLDHIFKSISDNAKLSKWAGGLGNDWTNIRSTNSEIKGTNGSSQGLIPFLKIVNDTAVAVNQGGKRKGAVCAYLETWHLDYEEFLELRKNTGDERRRTHDMHTASWILDLFMKRVKNKEEWTLFSPDEVPDLHHTWGQDFERRYIDYENKAANGQIKLWKKVSSVELWRKMLTRLFETGHPWLTWKDPSNIRSPQDHVGVVHNSNLCTEILLNTSKEETAVCNLGSINLPFHIEKNTFNQELIKETVAIAIRMLDNVIDINFYPTPEAKQANRRHRPVGLGIMGFQDSLYKLGISYSSKEAIDFADKSMETISYHAINASTKLAKERGPYPSYKGSKWDRGILPIDTIELLEKERETEIQMDRSSSLDWEQVRKKIQRNGMRNSNLLAIAPTATISNIIGVSQSIEPTYKNLYAKSNLSGDFIQVNNYLVDDLKNLGLWNKDMLDSLKYYDGSLLEIKEIPEELKSKYRTAFEVEPKWLLECASRRQKWIDMGQSLNLYLSQPSGKKLHDMYFLAWEKGLKTTYYLRTLSATQVEKSTLDVNRFGVQPRWMKNKSASGNIEIHREIPATQAPSACSLDDPECEACQ